MIDYYSDRDLDSANYYLEILKNKYPSQCYLRYYNLEKNRLTDSSFNLYYKRCKESGRVNDSIAAGVALVTYYLQLKKLEDVNRTSMKFYASDSNFSFSPFHQWERRQFFYVYSRSLLLAGDLEKFLNLVMSESGKYGIIRIEDEDQLKSYVEVIFQEYRKHFKGFANFEEYYATRFHPLKKPSIKKTL